MDGHDVDHQEKKKQLTAVTDIASSLIQNPPQPRQAPHSVKAKTGGLLGQPIKQATILDHR
jgi:hypothetical protein